MSSTSGLVLSTAMHRRIEHIAAELLICRSPASISNYIFSAVFTYFLGGFLRKKRWLLGLRPRPWWGSLQRSPTPPSWAGGVPPSRTLPGLAPPTTSPHPLPHPRRCPPPPSQFLDPPLHTIYICVITGVRVTIYYKRFHQYFVLRKRRLINPALH